MVLARSCLVLLSLAMVLVSGEGENSHSYPNKCPRFHIKKSTIIKTQQSVRDGAVFLAKKVMSSSRGCHQQCCKTDGCNLVMLKYDTESDVEKVSCFLFNCRSPSVCSFYQHSSYHTYAALEYEDKKTQYSSTDRGETHDTKDFHKEKITTTESPIPTTSKKSYESSKQENWGNVNWFDDITTSKPKYIKPKYHNDYDSKHTTKKDWFDEQEVDKLSTTHHSNNQEKSTSEQENASSKKAEPKKVNSYIGTKYGTYDHTQNVHEFPTEQAQATTEEDFPRRVFVDNNPDFPDEPGSHKELATTVKEAKPKTTESAPVQGTKGATKIPATKSKVNNYIIRKLNIQENKAVIPLAVGLVLALLLLMGVIFRLKTSRRRRTKAFLTDDADYLINGMYL